MKVSIARSELVASLGVVSRGMSSRSTLPILAGIYLRAAGGSLFLQSTDLEISVRHEVVALVEEEGEIVVPGRLLSDIVRSLPEAAVTIELDKETVHIRCLQAAFTLRTLSPADFPKFPEVEATETVVLPADTLSSMVKKVSRAVSRDETRAVLTGILLVFEGPIVKLVATDSYRLALIEKELENPSSVNMEVVIPGRALEEVTKISVSGEDVRMGVSANQVVFESGPTTFVSRRVEGSFPNYRQIIPNESSITVTIPTDEFVQAVKRVSLMALHNTPLRLAVSEQDQTLSLSAATHDVGDASEDLMAKVEGGDIEIGFNHSYLVDGVSGISSDTTTLSLQSSMKPGLLTSEGDDSFVYLLMPMRLG